MSVPFFSLILATRNAAQTLPRCLASLANQEWRDFEVILQDAASSDTTLAEAQAFQAHLPRLLAASEPDSGIYDAWNRALGRTTGQWLLFLGADDALEQTNALAQAAALLKELPKCLEYWATPVLLTNPAGRTLGMRQPSLLPSRDIRAGMPFPHQGLFHRCSLFACQRFDSTLHIAGDYDFLCRTLTPENLAYGAIPLVRMALGGISSDMAGMYTRDMEFLRITRRYFPGPTPFRLWARLLRGVMYKVVAGVCGRRVGLLFDDAISRIQGKPRMWSQMD